MMKTSLNNLIIWFLVIDHDLIPPMAGSHGSQEYQGWTVHLFEYSKKMTNENASRWLMNVALHLRVKQVNFVIFILDMI